MDKMLILPTPYINYKYSYSGDVPFSIIVIFQGNILIYLKREKREQRKLLLFLSFCNFIISRSSQRERLMSVDSYSFAEIKSVRADFRFLSKSSPL